MAMHVREAFLQYSKEHQLGFFRGQLHIIRQIDIDLDPAASAELFRVGPGRGDKAGYVQQRRGEKLRERTYFAHRILQKTQSLKYWARFVGLTPFDELFERHLDARECLAHTVV